MTHSSGSAPPDEDPPVVPSDPDHAWKALALVNDWVKHAEVKLGVVLAATGVSAGALFNLVKDRNHPSWVLEISAGVCAIAVLLAGVCTMIGLYPVVRIQRKTADDAVNPLFFHDVAEAYKANAPNYGAVLHTLTTNHNDLVRHLGQQIHANATVAQRKYRWANRAIRALLLDLLALGAVATIITIKK